MAHSKSILKSLACDPEGTFATAASSAYSAYVDVPAEGIEWTPAQEFLDRAVQTRTLGAHVAGKAGAKGGKVKFRTGIPGCSTSGASGVQVVAQPWLDELMQACGYAKDADTGGVVTGSGSTTTSIDMTDSSGISVGSLVMINGEVRMVTANSANTLTITPALTGAPAAADVVYAGANYTTSDGDPGTITLVAKGDGYLYRFLGCKGVVKLVEDDARKRPMLEFEFDADTFDTTEPSGSFPSRVLSNHIPSVVGSPFYWGSTKTVISGFAFDAGREMGPKLSTQGTNGRAGWIIKDEKPTMGFKPYYASAYATDFAAETARSVLAQIGAAAQACFAVYAHQAQITEGWNVGDIDGHLGHDVKTKILDTGSSAVTAPYTLAVF